ncbi:MAG: type I DNA topoisomerase [Candidatus Dormibacteria bacterium]
MPNDLIIVESAAKARTIKQYLGGAFDTEASVGHVRDLPAGKLGVDVENGFAPTYVVTAEKRTVDRLKKAVKGAGQVLLATDPDREGEAIAWHLAEMLNLKSPQRIVFHEVTRKAIQEAVSHPRDIDRQLVDAQQARRVLDRLVGYELSPLLGGMLKKGLGTGRVQSVAVRFVVERERERDAFQPVDYWRIETDLVTDRGEPITARYQDPAQKEDRDRILDGTRAEQIAAALRGEVQGPAAFTVKGLESRQSTSKPPLPYNTSSLQQDASTRLSFRPKRTMDIAQRLYEGLELGQGESQGLITYMRTDGTSMSPEAFTAATGWITEKYGKDHAAAAAPRGKAAQGAQEAHEVIRPTDPTRTPEDVRPFLDRDQWRLYELIWRRFMASVMTPATFQSTTATIESGEHQLVARGSVVTFAGFTEIWYRGDDQPVLPALTSGQALSLVELRLTQHATQPPPRYSEAALIQKLEERGIGRPSTYADTIEKIETHGYVGQEDRRLFPTRLGFAVTDLLVERFTEVIDPDFTAHMEQLLDRVQAGESPWGDAVGQFYTGFSRDLARAREELTGDTGEECPNCHEAQLKRKASKHGPFKVCPKCKYKEDLSELIRDERPAVATGDPCPRCGKPLVTRQSRRGPFVGCSGFPDCDYIQPDASRPGPVLLDEVCPKCNKHQLARKTGRRGEFVGCSGYPECDYIKSDRERIAPEPTGRDCPKCKKPLVTRQSRRGPFVGCSDYPRCKYTERTAAGSGPARPAPIPVGEDCPQCGKGLVQRQGPRGAFIGCSGYPKCRYARDVAPAPAS